MIRYTITTNGYGTIELGGMADKAIEYERERAKMTAGQRAASLCAQERD